ncbi:MAG: kelch repeat-containing protein, partial [Acidimicrobiales bacterium]
MIWVAAAPGSAAAATSTTTTPSQQPPEQTSWSAVSPPVSPPALAYASAAYDSDNNTVVVFGGQEPGGALSNDTWVWNGSTWTDSPGSRQFSPPPARQMASMAFDPKLHQLILFGGQGAGGQLLGGTWAWNGLSWVAEGGQRVNPSPSPREGAAIAYDGAGDLVLFGGTGVAQPTSQAPTSLGTTTTDAGTTTSTTAPGDQNEPGAGSGQKVALGDTWLWTDSGWVES